MDIRTVTLLVFICIAGSFAEFRSPFIRTRRNGMEENGRHVVDIIGEPRTRRAVDEAKGDSEKSNKTETVTTSTTIDTSSTPKSTVTPTTVTTPAPTPTPTPSSTPKSTSVATSITTTTVDSSKSKESTTSAPTTETTTKSAPKKPSDSGKSSDTESSSSTAGIGTRSNFEPESDPKESGKKAAESKEPAASPGISAPHYPGYPTFSPSFVPDYASPYYPYRGDPAFNSIPGTGNYAWTGTSHGPGTASAVASAGASSGSFSNAGFGGGPSVVSTRGAFVDDTPQTSNVPYGSNVNNVPYVPNMNNVPNVPYVNNVPYYYPGYGGSGVGSSFPGQNFGFAGFDPDPFNIQRDMEEHFRQLQAQIEEHQRSIFEANNRLGNDGGYGNSYGGSSMPGPQSAFSSINLGPRGGFQSGAIHPVAPGIESRFAEDVPAPSGNSFGVFSSSSSSTRVGPDGKQISHKSSTTGVNDNGKISFRTVHD